MKCTDNLEIKENVVVIEVNIIYTRIFMGEFFGCKGGYGNSTMAFNSEVKLGEIVIASHSSNGPMIYNRGFFGNIALISRNNSL